MSLLIAMWKIMVLNNTFFAGYIFYIGCKQGCCNSCRKPSLEISSDIPCLLQCCKKSQMNSNRNKAVYGETYSDIAQQSSGSLSGNSTNDTLLPTAPPLPDTDIDRPLLPTEITITDTQQVVPPTHSGGISEQHGRSLTGSRTSDTQSYVVVPCQYSHTAAVLPSRQCNNVYTTVIPPPYDQHNDSIGGPPDTPEYSEIDQAYPMVEEVGLAGEYPKEPPPPYCDL